ncbi:MAG: biotin/lipoyl-binding protein [Candidatus Eisenbacteria sp.]|nr:biotin/lipoyl-binding protein [Candidatus Eisenbacteria bacterium]
MISAELVYNGERYLVSVDRPEGATAARIDERSIEAEITRLSPDCFSLRIGPKQTTVFVARSDEKVFVHVGGRLFEFEEAGAQGGAFAGGGGAVADGSVSSPMPGRVVKMAVQEGQQVEKNQVLVIVEAMKMENPLKSSVAGTVKKIHYAEGDLVDAGKPIVEVEPAEE